MTWIWVMVTVVTIALPVRAQNGVAGGLPTASVSVLDSTKDQDGLAGSVRRVKVQSAKLEFRSGHLVEGPLQLLEITTYGLNGTRIDNASYVVAQTSLGKEEYKYNERGNITQMTLRGADGSILSRENYQYEFDSFGNWTKMITSLVVFENGELKQEPVEVTYREIAYYFDDSVARIVKRISPTTILPPAHSVFPGLANSLSPEMQPDKLTISLRALSIESAGEPPELPKPTRDERPTLTRSSAGANNPPESKLGPPVISSTPSRHVSPAAASVPSPATREAANWSSALHKSAIAYYEKGREYFGLGAFNEAVDFYRRSLDLEPRSAEVYLSLGHAYLNLKNSQEARKAFKEATVLNPELAEAHYGLGLNYFGAGRFKDAADAFKRTTILSPKLAKAHYGLALAYQELGRLDEVTAEIRILETLDKGLARKLSERSSETNLPCRVSRFCR